MDRIEQHDGDPGVTTQLPQIQTDLFGGDRMAPPVETPAARATDPITSHIAAEAHTASGVRAEQQQRAFAAVRAMPGMTSLELSVHCSIDRYELGRRLSELRTAGVIFNPCIEDGDVFKRHCTVSGSIAMEWWPKNPTKGDDMTTLCLADLDSPLSESRAEAILEAVRRRCKHLGLSQDDATRCTRHALSKAHSGASADAAIRAGYALAKSLAA